MIVIFRCWWRLLVCREERSDEMVLGHPIAECVAREFEEATGFRDVTGCFAERLHEHLLFHLLEGQSERKERRFGVWVRTFLVRCGSYRGRQMMRLYNLFFACDRQPFRDIE